ncbi:MAG: cache domain-containing protein [Bacillota bacterium]
MPIRVKLMALLVSVALIPSLLVGVLSLQALDHVADTTQQTGVAALEREATGRLDGLARQSAARLDTSFEQARNEATSLARYSGFLFSHPDHYARGIDLSAAPPLDNGLPQAEPVSPAPRPEAPAADSLPAFGLAGHLRPRASGVWANEKRDPVGVFLPAGAKDLDAVWRELTITSHLDSWFTTSQGVNPFRLDAFVILKDGLTRLYPNWGFAADSPDAGSFSPTNGSYYALATPPQNPDRLAVWTPPYQDPAGMGRMVTASAPIYTEKGEFLGVAGVDVLLSDVMKSLQSVNVGPSGYALLVDNSGRVVAAPDQALHDLSLPSSPVAPGGDVNLNLRQSNSAEVRQMLPDLISGDRAGVRELTLGGSRKYLAFAPLADTGWTLVLVEPTADVMHATEQLAADTEAARMDLRNKLQVVFLLLLLVVVVASLAAGTAVTNPLERLTQGVRALAGGQLKQPIALDSEDEIGELAREFNHMAEELTQLNAGLERKVLERTAELARKADQLRALNEASRQVAAVLEPDRLLGTLAGLVTDSFGYARTSIYLLDPDGAGLTLRAASAPSPSACSPLIARAADTRQPVMTAEELAVPIRLAERLLGALHVEVDRSRTLNEDDVFALSTLADQLAVGLENARLFAEERERRLEARDLAIAEERNRMAREIHDTLAQGFMGILLQLQAAEGEMGEDVPEVRRRLARAADLARESLQEARRSVWNLRPRQLERASLPEALRQEAGGLGALGGAELQFQAAGEERSLPPDVEAALLRVAQEAFSNIRKHAQASQVELNLEYAQSEVRLRIADNGRGFDPAARRSRSGAPDHSGFGLLSMRERVQTLGGTLEVDSRPGEGTRVCVRVPVRADSVRAGAAGDRAERE